MEIRKKVSIKPSCPPLEEISDEEFMVRSIKIYALQLNITLKESYKRHFDHCCFTEHINWDEVKKMLKMEE